MTNKLYTVSMFMRFGVKAILESIHAQIYSFTEPKSRLASCGKKTWFNRRCSFASPENIYIGKSVSVGSQSRLWASPNARLLIEDDVLIGPNVTIVTSNYETNNIRIPIHAHHWMESDVAIGRRSWLGANVVILPGVRIGEGAVIAAGAVVNSSIPAFAIAAGVPARVVKYRLGAEEFTSID